MGQKANLLTLKPYRKNFTLANLDTKTFLYALQFLKHFEVLLHKKNIWLMKKTVLFSANNSYINLELFYRSVKITSYNRKGFVNTNLRQSLLLNQGLFSLFTKAFPLNPLKLLVFNSVALNKVINKKILSFIYNKTKHFKNSIFVRRFTLYVDFLKITTLLIQNKVSAEKYVFLLMHILKFLSKRIHARFLEFLKALFKIIVFDLPKLASLQKVTNDKIAGLKFILNGKIKGKPRASVSTILEGSVPTQSFSTDIDFAKSHVYTLYGVFGIRIWIYRK